MCTFHLIRRLGAVWWRLTIVFLGSSSLCLTLPRSTSMRTLSFESMSFQNRQDRLVNILPKYGFIKNWFWYNFSSKNLFRPLLFLATYRSMLPRSFKSGLSTQPKNERVNCAPHTTPLSYGSQCTFSYCVLTLKLFPYYWWNSLAHLLSQGFNLLEKVF